AGAALALVHAGKHAESLPIFERALEVSLRKLGPAHPLTLDAAVNVAGVQRRLGKSAEATATLEMVHAGDSKLYGPDHPDTIVSAYQLGMAHFEDGKFAEAGEL